MKQHIESLIQTAIRQLQEAGHLPVDLSLAVQVDPTKDKLHGDFASNIALMLAKPAQKKPRDIAELITNSLSPSHYIEKVEIAGPGFINFFLSPAALYEVVPTILDQKDRFGQCTIGRGKRILVEYLSSNPTGPLHVGHGRHAAFGTVVCNLLEAVGFKPYREYYVNDAGRQMDILTASIWLRYLELCGEEFAFPLNGYKGEYVVEIARNLKDEQGAALLHAAKEVMADLPLDEPQGGDKEVYIDAIIERARTLLGEQAYEHVFTFGLKSILDDIEDDLAEFGVRYDNWFSERQFVSTGIIDELLATLEKSGHTYLDNGALWFRSTQFGDEKDRVLVRSNGTRTYFANDVAYHLSKFERGFDLAIDIFGSDHHGYVPRMKAAVEASGIDPERMQYLLVQFVTLYRNGEQVQMSTRSGSFITLRELREEVGNDAARYFYVMRKCEQHIDFDLDLAKSKSNENPVFYVQYAHARICSVFRQMAERDLAFDEARGLASLHLLTTDHERQLLNTLARYPELMMNAALQYEPHQLTNYLRDLATDFHAYYNSQQFIVDDVALRDARLALISATKQVLVNGFNLLGITAPVSM